jgi:uncharacterized Ntn-hydrolase superfamily protein
LRCIAAIRALGIDIAFVSRPVVVTEPFTHRASPATTTVNDFSIDPSSLAQLARTPGHATARRRALSMTWSILARDDEGRVGVAIASRFFAVGALCAHTRRGVGAVSTQALMNPLYGRAGLDALEQKRSAAEVVSTLIDPDDGRDVRQVHVLPAIGKPAAHTGSLCVEWCGHRVFDDFSVAGNMLAGPEVVDATVAAYRAAAGRPLAERLIAAMRAGEAAGGDKRGKQAAALRIQGDQDYLQLDLRVDDHEEPLIELERIYRKSLERFQPFVACLATRDNPTGELDRGAIEARVHAHAKAHGLDHQHFAR